MPISANMLSHLSSNVTSLCTLFKITAKDGTIIRAATHTQNITYNGELYLASPYKPTQIQNRAGLSPSNAEMNVVLVSGGFIEQDIVKGKWQFATVEIFVINYNSPADGYATYNKGHIGEITIQNGVAQIEYRSLTDLLNLETGDLYTETCPWTLGDANCTLNLVPFQVTTTINGTPPDRRTIPLSTGPADHYYLDGKITFNSGVMAGTSLETKDNIGNTLTLKLPVYSLPASGDSITLTAGDSKSREICRDRFSNILNFGGFPDIPFEKLFKFPQ